MIGKTGHWLHETATDQTYWSEGMYHLLETEPGSLEPSIDLVIETMHPEDRPGFEKIQKESRKTDKLSIFRHRLLLPNGKIKHVEDRFKHFFNENGEIIRSSGVVTDITEIIEKENQVQISNELLENIINTIPHFVFYKDAELKYLGCNKNFSDLFNIANPADLTGLTDYDLPLSPGHADIYRTNDLEVLTSGQAKLFFREPFRDMHGNDRTLQVSKMPLRDAQGNISGVLGIFNDITEQVQAERQISESHDMLELKARQEQELRRKIEKEIHYQEKLLLQKNKMATMGEMIAAITHQWMQPLNSLSLISELIKNSSNYAKMNSEFDLVSMANKMQNHIDFMAQTVEVFRKFFKSGDADGQFNASMAVEQVLMMVSSQIENHGIQLEKNIEPGVQVKGSQNEFMNVILNLVTNARDSIESNIESDRLISITMSSKNDIVTISVQDNGPGIPGVLLPARLFEVHETTKGEKGNGIGLYLARRIIESKMGGAIKAANNSTGAIITITLPVLKP